MSLTLLGVLILATWRLSSLLAQERGPFELFERLRYWAGVRYDVYSQQDPRNEMARGLVCIWCNSVWIGTPLAVLGVWMEGLPWYWVPLLALALSAGAIALNRLIEED
jgi:hypothetical protein